MKNVDRERLYIQFQYDFEIFVYLKINEYLKFKLYMKYKYWSQINDTNQYNVLNYKKKYFE